MRRLIWLPVAGFLLIAGATVATAAPALLSGASSALSGATELANLPAAAGSLLSDVLAELVGAGTITQEQSDAITDAVDTKVAEKRAEMEQRMEEMRAAEEQIQTFLEDDVITQDELNQLPADHPLRTLETALQDGQITLDELQDLRGGFHGFGPKGLRGEGGWGHNFRGGGPWLAPDDSDSDSNSDATPDATTAPATDPSTDATSS